MNYTAERTHQGVVVRLQGGMHTGRMHRRRHRVAHRDGWFCSYCLAYLGCLTCDSTLPEKFEATLDHHTPVSLCRKLNLPPNDFENLVLACRPCNDAKAHHIWSLSDPLATVQE